MNKVLNTAKKISFSLTGQILAIFMIIAVVAWADTTNFNAVQLDTTANDATAFQVRNPSKTPVFTIANDGTVTTSGGGFSLANSESLDTIVDATFNFKRNDAGVVTLTSSDNNSTADMTIDAGGNAAMIIGSASDTLAFAPTAGFTLSNSESLSNGTDGSLFLGRNDAGTVTLTSKDNDATAALTIDPGGNAALTLGSASDTISVPVTAGIALSNAESISNGTDGSLFLGRNDAGTVTLTAKDDDATAALTVLPGGAAAMTLGGASTTSVTVTTDGTGTAEVALPAGSIDTTEVLDATLKPADDLNPGRGIITICGDAVTVNNNTVYYGPDVGITSSATVAMETCNSTALGNTTEATADTPKFTNQAFQVLGMICRDAQAVAFSRSFTLRNNAAATVPSVTCTMASNERDCVANVQTTTAIAANNPIAIAVASGSDVTTNNFECTIQVAF